MPDDPTGGNVDFTQGLTVYGPLGVFVIAAMFVIGRLFTALATAWNSRIADTQANTTAVLNGLNNTTTALQAVVVSQERQNRLQEELVERLAALEGRIALMEARK